MSVQKLKSFDSHLKEMMQDPEFAKGYEEEKHRLRMALLLADFRQQYGLSQTELAKRSGITQQQLSKLEQGENCNINTLFKVCNSLGLEIELKKSA